MGYCLRSGIFPLHNLTFIFESPLLQTLTSNQMKTQLVILCLAVYFLFGCKNDDPSEDPARFLSGAYYAHSTVYQNQNNQYPVNGKTISIQIDRISPDTVQVRVNAPSNGLFSPARDTTYRRVYMVPRPSEYSLTLEADTSVRRLSSEIVFWRNPKGQIDRISYLFAPPGFISGRMNVELVREGK